MEASKVLERGIRLRRNDFLIAALCAMTLCIAAAAEPISVRHIQRPNASAYDRALRNRKNYCQW